MITKNSPEYRACTYRTNDRIPEQHHFAFTTSLSNYLVDYYPFDYDLANNVEIISLLKYKFDSMGSPYPNPTTHTHLIPLQSKYSHMTAYNVNKKLYANEARIARLRQNNVDVYGKSFDFIENLDFEIHTDRVWERNELTKKLLALYDKYGDEGNLSARLGRKRTIINKAERPFDIKKYANQYNSKYYRVHQQFDPCKVDVIPAYFAQIVSTPYPVAFIQHSDTILYLGNQTISKTYYSAIVTSDNITFLVEEKVSGVNHHVLVDGKGIDQTSGYVLDFPRWNDKEPIFTRIK